MELTQLLMIAFLLRSCGYNAVINRDDDVKAAYAEVENPFKRRSDLIPYLVNTIKGPVRLEKKNLKFVILSDTGINNLIGTKGWQQHITRRVFGLRNTTVCQTLLEALDEPGSILANEFPPRANDTNELCNKVVVAP